MKKVSNLVIDFLADNNINTFFLVTGGAIAPIVDYIGTKEDVDYFCFQHEQSAAMAAESYYKTTGKVSAVFATSGPGAQNLMNGLCGCWFESIPAIFITGQVSSYESIDSIEQNPRQLGFQETPVVDMFKPFTKYCTKITDVNQIPKVISEAICEMHSDRFGPVLIDLPVNIQNTKVDIDLGIPHYNVSLTDSGIDSKIEKLSDYISISQRPLILLGNGVRLSDSIKDAREFVEYHNIPFVVSWGGFDLIEHSHPLFVGDIGVYGSRSANFAIQNCDLLIVLGSRLDTRQTGGDLKLFSRDSKKVMVDLDENEIFKGSERGLNIDLPFICDLQYFFTHSASIQSSTFNSEWFDRIKLWKTTKFDTHENNDSLNAYKFLEVLNELLPNKSIVIPDEGGHLVWTMQSLNVKENQRIFTNFGNSSMGYALPAAIGAAVDTDKTVICIDGDGGFQMNIQELQTIVNYQLPIKIFIINNECYGIIKQFQDAYFDSRYIATEPKDYSSPSFSKVSDAYGIKSVKIDINSDIKNEVQKVLDYSGPILCEVMVDKDQKLNPKLEFGNPLEDMYPYLSDRELSENMIIDMVERRDNSKGWVTLENNKEQ